MKIAIALLVPILLGIVVGSNLSPVMIVIILNQPTIALPIGVWLMMAIGVGILSSTLIQLAIFVDRRRLNRQIRQLQSRLQQPIEDIFTYTSPAPEPKKSSSEKPDTPNPKPSRFSSYRSKVTDRFKNPPSTKPIIIDERDDWEAEPVTNRQLDWEDRIPPRQENLQTPNNRSTIDREQIYPNPRTQTVETIPEETRREVYDADFRLIQPPYKEPLETEFDDDRATEDFEYTEIDEDEDFNLSSSSAKPTSPHRATPSSNLDDEDWGFDFDDRDTSVRAN